MFTFTTCFTNFNKEQNHSGTGTSCSQPLQQKQASSMKKMQPWGHVQGKLSKDSLTSLELTDKQKCFFIFILNGVDNFFGLY